MDTDGPDVHRRRLVDVPVGRHRVSGRPARRRMPADPHDAHHPLRLLGASSGPGRSGAAADHVLFGGRHRGAGDGSRRGTRRDPGAAHVRQSQGAVPVPGARRDVASVLRRRPRRPLARCLGLVPVALHGLPVYRSVARTVGAPIRPPSRIDERTDLRRAAHVVRPERGRPCDVRCPRLVPRAGCAARLVPPPRRVPAGDAHVAGRPAAVVGRRAARRRPGRAEVGPALHGRDGVRADRRTPRLDGDHAVRPGGRGRATGGPGRRRRRVLRTGG